MQHLERRCIFDRVCFFLQGIDYSSQMGSRSEVATACHANAARKVDGRVAGSAAPAARRLLRRASHLLNYPEKAAYGVCAAHYCAATAASVCSPRLKPEPPPALYCAASGQNVRAAQSPCKHNASQRFVFVQPITNTTTAC